MPGAAIRRGVWALGIAAALIVLIVLGLPFLASTQIVRDSITHQMSAWSGYRVELGEAPEIRVWPSFHAVLHEVSLSEWGQDGDRPVIESETATIDLSALAALQGEVVFTKLSLERPVLRVRTDPGQVIPDSPTGGKLSSAISIARALVATDPAQPDTGALPTDPFGTIEFSDGRIVDSTGGSDKAIVTSLGGMLGWPALDRPANLSATGIWQGENVTLQAVAGQPLLLLGGGNAPLSVSIEAAPLSASFEGEANISEDTYIDGRFRLSSQSLRRLLEWSRPDVAAGSTVGSIDLSGQVAGGPERMKFENASIGLDGSTGNGVLDMTFSPSPGVSGTLDFDRLDLRSFLSAFMPLARDPDGGATAGSFSTRPFTTPLDVDLRLSSASAAVGPVSLSQVAATAQVKDGFVAFDISDSAAFGGTVQFGVRVDRTEDGRQAELRMVGEEIDGGALASALDIERFMPRSRGSFSVIVKGNGAGWDQLLRSADGSVTASFSEGTLPGLDLPAYLERSGEDGFFALSEISDGELAITGGALKATLSGGVARIDSAEVRTGERVITLGGLVPLGGRGLALSGTLAPASEGGPEDVRASFFVGGSWNSPFIAPVLPGLPPG